FNPVPEVVHPAAPEPYRPPEIPQPAPPALSPISMSRVFHGIMFDAGSTGTRIHIYKFIQKDPELPVLDNEMFHAVKPGLSSYKDNPEEGGNTIRQLLKIAKKTVPEEDWRRTPVVLRATAGLRLLPQEQASRLLKEVKEVFDESPFFVPNNSVSIMPGTNEVLAWVTVNFLTHLYSNTRRTVGILDLGGGSTQITFLPKSKKTIQSAPSSYIANFNLFNHTYQLYTHYLGNGLVAARLSAVGALGADVDWKVFTSPCLPKRVREELNFSGTTYKVSGIPDYAGYKLCYYEMMRVIKGIVHQPYELKGSSLFYAFSHYFDRANESGLISRGGTVEVRDFKKKAKECNKMSKYRTISPFLCMDLTYITCLLKEGFGFKDNTKLHLAKKVNNVETSWALGATFDYFRNLNIH
uniref:nucleoside diphosphate phosphatase n=1 Tax=Periophthalmus magnuspinnatus TaxID=409849 RepID=A0A3B4AC18_9GOBI